MDNSSDKYIHAIVSEFITHYGITSLEQAFRLYADMQMEYICKTKTAISKLKICEIYYLEIAGHHIDVHTEHETYHKYGTLNQELLRLSSFGFLKCNQSCIVSLHKIKTILNNEIILTNQTHLYLSRHYAPKVLMTFSHKQFLK